MNTYFRMKIRKIPIFIRLTWGASNDGRALSGAMLKSNMNSKAPPPMRKRNVQQKWNGPLDLEKSAVGYSGCCVEVERPRVINDQEVGQKQDSRANSSEMSG